MFKNSFWTFNNKTKLNLKIFMNKIKYNISIWILNKFINNLIYLSCVSIIFLIIANAQGKTGNLE